MVDRVVQNPDGSFTRFYTSGATGTVGDRLGLAQLVQGVMPQYIDEATKTALREYTPEQRAADLRREQLLLNEQARAYQAQGNVLTPEEQAILRAEEEGSIITTPQQLYNYAPELEPSEEDIRRINQVKLDALERQLERYSKKPEDIPYIYQGSLREALTLARELGPEVYADFVARYEKTPGGISLSEAERAAEVFAGATNTPIKDPAELDYLTSLLASRGYDEGIQSWEELSGLTFGVASPVTYDTAKSLATELYKLSGIPTSGINPQTGARYDEFLNNWTNKIRYSGLEKTLEDWNRANNKNFNVNDFSSILEKEPGRLENLREKNIENFMTAVKNPPSATQQFQPQGIPQFEFAQQFQPQGVPQVQFAPQQQQPLYPQQPMPQGLPALITQPTERPTLDPRTQTIGVPPALLVPTEAPVLSPQTAYIGVPTATQAAPAGMKEGGLASAARQVASEGRRGDSMLVHMTPGEVAGLQSLAQMMGGSLTVNPDTGLPEANFFKKILPIVAAVAAPYLAPVAGALGVSAPLLVGGLAGAGSMLGGGSLKDGLTMGLTAGLSSSLTTGMMGKNPLGVGGDSTFNLANTFGGAAPATKVGPGAGAVDVTGGNFGGLTQEEFYGDLSKLTSGEQGLTTAGALQPPPVVQTNTQAAAKSSSLMDYALPGYLAMGTLGAVEQNKLAQEEMARIREAEEAKKRRGLAAYERSGLRDIPLTGATGGLVAMAGGGMTYMEAGGTTGPTGAPRDVTGTGDGMSDSVPATIEGVQEARLADGEFVIPADVVADIGNGSSDAGSKKLYDMMDRIRKARHGTTEQPPEINAEALMPA